MCAMTLQEKLNDEWKNAMRSGDNFRRDTLSMLRSAVKTAAINARPAGSAETTLDDEAAQSVLEREAKKRRDSIDEYTKASRIDLAENEALELKIVQEFLPQQLSDEEIESAVREAIAQSGATDSKQMGAVMKLVQPKVAGRADGKRVSETVKRLLQG